VSILSGRNKIKPKHRKVGRGIYLSRLCYALGGEKVQKGNIEKYINTETEKPTGTRHTKCI